MEEKDMHLIRELAAKDKALQHLWQEHLEYEKKLEELDGKPYLTPEEIMERKRIQKLKLAGKDQIYSILTRYRKAGGQ